MRFDWEFCVAEAVVEYLEDVLSDDFQKCYSVVTFFDPMSSPDLNPKEKDTGNRVIVTAEQGQTMLEQISNASLPITIGLKTRWTQSTVKDDFIKHRCNLSILRDALFPRHLEDDLQAWVQPGCSIDKVLPTRQFSTKTFTDGWIYSETTLHIDCHSKFQPGEIGQLLIQLPRAGNIINNTSPTIDPQDAQSSIVGGDQQPCLATLLVRGIAEWKDYSSIAGAIVQGTDSLAKQLSAIPGDIVMPGHNENEYVLLVSDPASAYVLNNRAMATNAVLALGYEFQVPMNPGAKLTLHGRSVDGREYDNVTNLQATTEDGEPPVAVAQPFDGQFVQVDCLKIDPQ